MNYEEQVLSRATTEKITEFLLFQDQQIDDVKCKNIKIQQAYSKLNDLLKETYGKDCNAAVNMAVDDLVNTAIRVYAQIGLCAGVTFITEIYAPQCDDVDMYQEMYNALFQDISKALKILGEEENKNDIISRTMSCLKMGQRKAEDIFVQK